MTARRPHAAGSLTRRQVVWLSLIGAMTSVGGVLLATESRPAPPPVLAALDRPTTDLSAIFSSIEGETRNWRGIVVHHSEGTRGSAASIDAQHRDAGLRGLGYHFVIGNGSGSGDGEVEVGFRWTSQLPGAHAGGPNAEDYNRQTIGICLVGDGERRAFTDAQLASLAALVQTLQDGVQIADRGVTLHREIAPTVSPGRMFPEAWFKARLAENR